MKKLSALLALVAFPAFIFAAPAAAPAAPPAVPAKTAPAPSKPPAPFTATWLDSDALKNSDPSLDKLRQRAESLKYRKTELEAKLALADAQSRLALAATVVSTENLQRERGLRTARLAEKNAADLADKKHLERAVAFAKATASMKIAADTARLKSFENEEKLIRAETELSLADADARTALHNVEDKRAGVLAASAAAYPDDPLKDGILTISDRRIPFNGIVTENLADFVTSRIAFYNNADTAKPIFIVIDSSPGGSVFAGYRILQAMEGSKAPVYVVVKQFAASMAAITTTVAKRSFCLPNTLILHHQMSGGNYGNITQIEESRVFMLDLQERIFGPVYRKTGYKDLPSFVKDMYENFRSGDWQVFGDEAVKRKWASDLVTRIRETGVRELPKETDKSQDIDGVPIFLEGALQKRDAGGKIRHILPPLTTPGDAWFISDPEHRLVLE